MLNTFPEILHEDNDDNKIKITTRMMEHDKKDDDDDCDGDDDKDANGEQQGSHAVRNHSDRQ